NRTAGQPRRAARLFPNLHMLYTQGWYIAFRCILSSYRTNIEINWKGVYYVILRTRGLPQPAGVFPVRHAASGAAVSARGVYCRGAVPADPAFTAGCQTHDLRGGDP